MSDFSNSAAIVIPSLNPDHNLVSLVTSLRKETSIPIIVVNDGSRPECDALFERLSQENDVTILRHAVNCGKGRACKTAFNYYLNTYPDGPGVVTCDADGQHSPDDIIRGIRELSANPDSLILGCRDFSSQGVPWKSSFGNNVTRFVYALCTRKFIGDTQTGLRGIPRDFLKYLLTVDGERFEFETLMLLECVALKIPIREYPIATIYIDSNRETNFRPIKDSLMIYLMIFRHVFRHIVSFFCSGVLSALVDISLFHLFFHFAFSSFRPIFQLGCALAGARAISLTLNYMLNRNGVFQNQQVRKRKTFPKFLVLCGVVFCLAYVLNWWGEKLFPSVDPTIIKMAVDGLLFFFSFFVQKNFIFRKASNLKADRKNA